MSDGDRDDLEAYFLRREFREPERFRCSDGMCGADDCARCHPEGERVAHDKDDAGAVGTPVASGF